MDKIFSMESILIDRSSPKTVPMIIEKSDIKKEVSKKSKKAHKSAKIKKKIRKK